MESNGEFTRVLSSTLPLELSPCSLLTFDENKEDEEERKKAFINKQFVNPLAPRLSVSSKMDKLFASRTLSLNQDYCFECATDAEMCDIMEVQQQVLGDLITRKRFSSGGNLIGRSGRTTVSTMVNNRFSNAANFISTNSQGRRSNFFDNLIEKF